MLHLHVRKEAVLGAGRRGTEWKSFESKGQRAAGNCGGECHRVCGGGCVESALACWPRIPLPFVRVVPVCRFASATQVARVARMERPPHIRRRIASKGRRIRHLLLLLIGSAVYISRIPDAAVACDRWGLLTPTRRPGHSPYSDLLIAFLERILTGSAIRSKVHLGANEDTSGRDGAIGKHLARESSRYDRDGAVLVR